MFHLLLLSAGSLLGQNVLDSLDGRRDRVRITGLNTTPDNPRLFRCDRARLAPATASPEFPTLLRDVIQAENPDLILPGRDEDLLALAQLVEEQPSLASRIPVGSLATARILHDKVLSHRFALEHDLPFARTFLPQATHPESALAWADTVGYPILAKPREGFGSLGIRILLTPEHLQALLRRRPVDLLLQEMLDFGEDRIRAARSFLESADTGVPLFFHLPDPRQFAGQVLIGPDGSLGPIFTSCNLMVLGRCEASDPVRDPALADITHRFASAIAAAGWRGWFNLQCRHTPDGYRVHELNGRMSGSSSARRWLGFDEPRQVILAFRHHDIGPDPREDAADPTLEGRVYRSLTDTFVSDRAIRELATAGIWTAPQTSPHPR